MLFRKQLRFRFKAYLGMLKKSFTFQEKKKIVQELKGL